MVCGVTVLYNPTEEVFENINSYLNGLNKLYLVDNSEKENEKLKDNFIKFSSKIEYIKMNGNEGIAKALNVAKNKAIEENYTWLLTMDQDSKFENDSFFYFLSQVQNNFEDKIAIYSPYHKTFSKIKNLLFLFNKNKRFSLKKSVMTSGNILNLNIIKEIGDFEEKFFIDEVDIEYCYRVKKANYKIIVFNNVILQHNLGEIKKKGNLFLYKSHNYIRRYYITRNKFYMMDKSIFFKLKYTITLLRDILKIILLEENKKIKLKMFYLGMRDYKNKITGKINPKYIENNR